MSDLISSIQQVKTVTGLKEYVSTLAAKVAELEQQSTVAVPAEVTSLLERVKEGELIPTSIYAKDIQNITTKIKELEKPCEVFDTLESITARISDSVDTLERHSKVIEAIVRMPAWIKKLLGIRISH